MSLAVGVAGGGVGERLHIPLLRDLPDCNVRRVSLPHVGGYGGQAAYKLPLSPDLDWLVIATPPFAHIAHIRHALIAGIRHVLCEKPGGLSARALRELRNSNLGDSQLFINYQLRFDPALDKLNEMVGGSCEAITIVYESTARRSVPVPRWYTEPAAGGGVLISLGSHLIDLVHVLGWSFDSVRAQPANAGAGVIGLLDGVRLLGSLSGGAMATVTINARARRARFAVGLTHGRTTKWFDMVAGGPSDGPTTHPATAGRGRHALSSVADRPWREAQHRFYASLADADLTDESPARPADAERVHHVLAAAGASMRCGGATVNVAQ